MTQPNFGDVVDTNFIYSQEQDDVRKYGFSEIQVSGRPTIYHPGDVVHLPYEAGETSTMEAVGLAWAAFASGVTPE
jgi:hypothetical protein